MLAEQWQLWSVIAVVLLVLLVVKAHDARRLARSGIAEVDRMDGRSFEEYLGTLFRRLGYSAEVTPYSGDYGADLVISRAGRRVAVQAKRSRGAVGPRAVQEAAAAQPHYRCQGAAVITNSRFTAAARRLAAENGVVLWDRSHLVGKMLELRRQDLQRGRRGQAMRVSMTEVATGDAPLPGAGLLAAGLGTSSLPPPSSCCSTCGTRVSDKVREYCLARPRRFGGKIYCYRHQRFS